MKNILIINAHQPYPYSEGRLNRSLAERAEQQLTGSGYAVKTTAMTEAYETQAELEKHTWADAVILQAPVNWMGVPWSFKKYMDDVYSAGTGGELCNGDGRHRADPNLHYGSGGTANGKKYMLSLTFNAPQEAFNDPDQFLFRGLSVDDLFAPMHLTYRFFDMEPLETFVCYDVMKNPDIENDFNRFADHLNRHFPAIGNR